MQKENKIIINDMGDIELPHEIDDLINHKIEESEKHIEDSKLCNCKICQQKRETANVHFVWNKYYLDQIKKIAEKKGLKYQPYMRSLLKQTVDKEMQHY